MALQTTESSPGPPSPPSTPKLDKGKRPAYQNRSWVRGRDPEPMDGSQEGSETGRPSLLSRLESSGPSLLKRIALSEEASSEPVLATRIMDPLAQDEGEESYDEDMDMREERPPPSANDVQIKSEDFVATLPPSPTAERRGWKARGSRPTINVFGEPTLPAPTSKPPDLSGDATMAEKNKEEEWSPTPEPTVVDETEVDALLADIFSPSRTSSVAPTQCRTPTPCLEDTRPTLQKAAKNPVYPSPKPSVVKAHLPTSPSLPANVLDKCRELLLPTIVHFAKLRRPDMDAKSAERRIVARLSDDRTAELVKLARQVRTQMEEQNRMAQKRRLDADPEDAGQPPLKLPRKNLTRGEDMEVNAQHDVFMGSSTSIMPCDDAASLQSQGGGGVATPALNVRPSSEACLESHNRPNTLMHALAFSSNVAPQSQHSTDSLAHVRSALRQSIRPTSETLLSSTSPVMSEPVSSAFLLPAATLTSSTPLLPHSRIGSPAPAQNQDTLSSSSLNTSRRDIVTPPPRSSKDTSMAHDPPQDAMQDSQNQQARPMEEEPSTLVPALWSAVHGRSLAGVENIEFHVDNATSIAAQHWACRKDAFRFRFEDRFVKVHLLCLPTTSVSEVYQNLPADASRGDIVAALWNIKSEWPSPGTLVVQTDVNCPGSPWMPGQESGPLDITGAIRHGLNKFRLIELTDMSSKLFVFHAAEPNEEECRDVGAETIGWTRALTKLSLHSPKSPREWR
ncbi:hypothetical protein BC628DRAFT_34009 [Trametes gibbosa]|nr:hypothetical protein BC628DRAFT_34009 [Trametes gibbosa]